MIKCVNRKTYIESIIKNIQEQRNNRILNIKSIINSIKNSKKNIYIFTASYFGKNIGTFLKRENIEFKAFIDSFKEGEILNKKILKLKDIKDKKESIILIPNSKVYGEEVYSDVIKEGFSKDNVFKISTLDIYILNNSNLQNFERILLNKNNVFSLYVSNYLDMFVLKFLQEANVNLKNIIINTKKYEERLKFVKKERKKYENIVKVHEKIHEQFYNKNMNFYNMDFLKGEKGIEVKNLSDYNFKEDGYFVYNSMFKEYLDNFYKESLNDLLIDNGENIKEKIFREYVLEILPEDGLLYKYDILNERFNFYEDEKERELFKKEYENKYCIL